MRNVTALKKDTARTYKVLAVDDNRADLLMLNTILQNMGFEVVTAKSGREALNLLKEMNTIDVILLDREMPEMSGIEVVGKLKANAKISHIPVIMQTGSDKPEQIREGIDAGVFYYLTKPLNNEVLKSVLSAAVVDIEQQNSLKSELEKHKNSFGLVEDCVFVFSKLHEAEYLATFLANFYPNPERVVTGIAELLINSIEHGTLNIFYVAKTNLVSTNSWRNEVEKRERLPENKGKSVKVIFARRKDGLYLRITDQGPGFDWRAYLQIDPARASDNHGRGIALANMVSFDKLAYNEVGNEVTAFANLQEEELEW